MPRRSGLDHGRAVVVAAHDRPGTVQGLGLVAVALARRGDGAPVGRDQAPCPPLGAAQRAGAVDVDLGGQAHGSSLLRSVAVWRAMSLVRASMWGSAEHDDSICPTRSTRSAISVSARSRAWRMSSTDSRDA